MKSVIWNHAPLLGVAVLTLSAAAGNCFAASTSNQLADGRPKVQALAEDKKDDKGEKIAVDKLPKAVVDAVKKDMPGARITKANKLSKEGKVTFYLDDVKVGKKGWDVTVAEDGTILKKEECHDE